MIKFMRKHNKKLLAIFASGLLVVWLGSTALEEMFRADPGKQVAGRAFGSEFRRRDLADAHARTEVLRSINMSWDMPWGSTFGRLIDPVDQLTWFLLDREARRSGIQIPRREVERFLTMARIPGQWLESARDHRGISIDRIMDVIADQIRISRVGELAATSVEVSVPEVNHLIRDTREKLTVRMALFRAGDFANPKYQPDADTLEKHFYKYSGVLPDEGESGYGYKWPDRVRVEYLVADVDKIVSAMKISRDETRDYWADHRREYTRQVPVASAPASKPTTSSQPSTAASQPAASKPATKTVVKSFDEAREEAESDLKKERGPVVAEKLIRLANNRLLEPWYDVTPDKETGYRSAPPGLDAPDYLAKVAGRVCRANDLPSEVLRVVKPGRWLTRKDALELAGIGEAVIEGQQPGEEAPTTFADLAFRVPGLYTPPRDSSLRGLSLYEPFNTPLVETKEGMPHNYYVFRVVAAEASHAPKTIDEVKERVRRDVIELDGYRRAGEAVKKVLPRAQQQGLQAAVKADAALTERLGDHVLITPEPFARRRSMDRMALQFGLPLTAYWPIEELGVVEERQIGSFPIPMKMVAERFEPEVARFMEVCFGLAPKSGAASQPTPSVGLVEMPRSRQWALVEFVRIDRLSVGDYAKIQQQAYELLRLQRTIAFTRRWFDSEQVKKRADFAPATEKEEG